MDVELITITEYCRHHHTDITLLEAMADNGLISVVIVDGQPCISYDQLREIESYVHLHDELNVNIEGIDTIRHLLIRMKQLQQEVALLKSRLSRYE